MMRFVFAIALAMPLPSLAADYIQTEQYSTHRTLRARCEIMQSGAEYCIERPVERVVTDCTAGVDCHHMQSGQHYSVQSPLRID